MTAKKANTTHITDKGALHAYRIELPILLDDMQLSVYAFRLYAHLKRRAGDSGVCFAGTRSIAAVCCMSLGQVTKAKAELEAAGLINRTTKGARGGQQDWITMVDIWPQNMRTYCTDTRDPVVIPHTESVHSTNTSDKSVHSTNTSGEAFTPRTLSGLSVHGEEGKRSPDERKKIQQESVGGGGAALTEKILLDAQLFPSTVKQILAMNLDPLTLIASVQYLVTEGWGPGAIADRIRNTPPPKGQPYERPATNGRPAQDLPPDRPRRIAVGTQRGGTYTPTGGAELRDPGWQDRLIAEAEARAKAEL